MAIMTEQCRQATQFQLLLATNYSFCDHMAPIWSNVKRPMTFDTFPKVQVVRKYIIVHTRSPNHWRETVQIYWASQTHQLFWNMTRTEGESVLQFEIDYVRRQEPALCSSDVFQLISCEPNASWRYMHGWLKINTLLSYVIN